MINIDRNDAVLSKAERRRYRVSCCERDRAFGGKLFRRLVMGGEHSLMVRVHVSHSTLRAMGRKCSSTDHCTVPH